MAIEEGIELARRQNAKYSPIFDWFEEGFDTAGLRAARTLLDELTDPAIAAEG